MLETAPLVAAAKAMRKRVVLTHHTDLILTGGAINKAAERAVFLSGVAGGRMADTVVTYTNDRATVSPYIRRIGSRVEQIYPPIEITEPDSAGVARFRTRHELKGPVVGFAGRFAEEKGCDDLLRTIPQLTARFPNMTIVFAGEYRAVVGENLYERCQSLLAQNADHVRLVGVLTGQDLADFYAACDVLVLPSVNYTETFGLVQVEAMICGTPVVASNLPGVREPIRVTGMGRTVEPRKPVELAQAILEVIENRENYMRPPELIRSIFSIEATVSAYETVYRGER
jgi:glycosyltransferase involved in cell wall biosynthesis